jgi:hypothetical protein
MHTFIQGLVTIPMVYRQLVRLNMEWIKGLPYAPLIC